MAHDNSGHDPMAIGSSEDEGGGGAAAPPNVASEEQQEQEEQGAAAAAATRRATTTDESDADADDADNAAKKNKPKPKPKPKPTPAKKPAPSKPTAARRAEAERVLKEDEEKRERERVAAGPRFAALANKHATELLPLLVSHGGGALSPVDLCELAVASKSFAAAVRAFWASVQPQPPSAAAPTTTATAAAAAAPTTTTTATNAAALLSALSLEFQAWDAGRDRNERRSPGVTCAACGGFPAVASGYTAANGKPVCKGCFGGMATAFDASRGERALLAHCAAVLAPTAAHLFGTTPEEVVAAVPRYRPRLASMKKERGMRVSLRQAANWAMKNTRQPGPLGVRRRRASAALAEAAELSADVPRGGPYYESLDCRAMDFRRHALRKALALALKGRVYSPPPPADDDDEAQGGGGAKKPAARGKKKAAAPLSDRPFDFEKHGGAALQAAAASHIGAGTPSVAAIVAMAIKMAEQVQPLGPAAGGAAGAAGAGVAEEEEEGAAAAAAPAGGKKKKAAAAAAPAQKRKAPAKPAAKAPAAKKKKKAEAESRSDESSSSSSDEDEDVAPAAAKKKKKPAPPPPKAAPKAAAAAKKKPAPAPGRGRGGGGK